MFSDQNKIRRLDFTNYIDDNKYYNRRLEDMDDCFNSKLLRIRKYMVELHDFHKCYLLLCYVTYNNDISTIKYGQNIFMQ